MEIEITRGQAAMKLLEDRTFVDAWEDLRRGCSWSTAFQGVDYARAWYRSYAGRYEPVLVAARSGEGLSGLLALAAAADGSGVCVVGGRQAEYQAWLCPPELADSFPWEAIRATQRDFHGAQLSFRYLPPGVPLDWTRQGPAGGLCKLTSHSRPLLRFGDGSEIRGSLAKKSNKSRLGRLRKIGPIEFMHVTDRRTLDRHMDEIIRFYDLRQAAVRDSRPFGADDRKRAFHLAMAETDNLLHVTLLKVGGGLASAHLGVISGRQVQLGIIAHHPPLSAHSPGKFHILFLAQMLLEQGFESLDLTPGGDPYKERFANDRDTVHTLVVYPGRLKRLARDVGEATSAAVKGAMKAVHISPRSVKAFAARLRKIRPIKTPLKVLADLCRTIHCRREMRVYYITPEDAPESDVPPGTGRDVIDHLLCYEPCEAWQSRKAFLSRALARFEQGDVHSYTFAENGKLLHYGWLIEREEKSFVREVRQEFTFPPNSACLFDFYTFPAARGRGIHTANLRRAIRDATMIPGTERIYALVLADNRPSRHVIEKLGFNYETSLFEEVWFGRAKHWRAAQPSQ